MKMIDEDILSWYNPKTNVSILTQEKLYNEHYPDGQYTHFGTVLNFPKSFDVTKKSLKDYVSESLFECEEKYDVFSLIDDFFDKGKKKLIIGLERREEMQILRRLIFEYAIIKKGWTKIRTITSLPKVEYLAECGSIESARDFVSKFIVDKGFSVSSTLAIDIIGKKKFLPKIARPELGYSGKYLNKIIGLTLKNHQEIEDFVNGVERTDFGKQMMAIRNGSYT